MRDDTTAEFMSPNGSEIPEAREPMRGNNSPAEHDASLDREPVDRELPDSTPATGRHKTPSPAEEHEQALFGDADSDRFRTRWHDVQAGFVDDPQRAVQDADQLVEELVRTLTATFAQRKQSLEGQWQHGGEAETEDLRLALRGYRTFFDQLLPH